MDDIALIFVEADPATAAARLDDDSIHLWRVPYARSSGRVPLHALLGAYLDVPASEVTLEQGAHGKPRLFCAPRTPGTPPPTLEFNWSHSGDWALVALARDLALGVDLEWLRKMPHALELARRFFDPAETAALASVEGPERERQFISLWCAKEAVLKATGSGLSFGLARLAFVPDPDGGWQLARTDPAVGNAVDWKLVGFPAAHGYRGALAWRGASRRVLAMQAAKARAG